MPLHGARSHQNDKLTLPPSLYRIASQRAWEIVRSLVVGYIEEEEPEPDREPESAKEKQAEEQSGRGASLRGDEGNPVPKDMSRAFRIAGKAVIAARLRGFPGKSSVEVRLGFLVRFPLIHRPSTARRLLLLPHPFWADHLRDLQP